MLCADELIDAKNGMHSLFVVVWGKCWRFFVIKTGNRYITSITHLDEIYNEVQKIGVAGLWACMFAASGVKNPRGMFLP